MELLIFTANQTGNKKNCYYPNRVVAKNTAELQKAVMMDHVCAEYRNDYRSNANFMQSVVVVMDCDNDHSELPGDWMTPDTESRQDRDSMCISSFMPLLIHQNMPP